MRKVRSDAKWNSLTKEQAAALEEWLFEEHMSFESALGRAQMELGYPGSLTSLKRYYARRAKERTIEDFTSAREEAETIEQAPADMALMRKAGMKVVSRLFLRQVMQAPGDVKEWRELARLMLATEDLELRRELKTEENKLRREALEFARERFHFDTVEKALELLPELQELAEARKDPKQRGYEENKRVNAIIRSLFGRRPRNPDNPNGNVHPENAEEEAAVEEAQRRRREEEERRVAAARQQAEEEEAARAREAAERERQYKVQPEQLGKQQPEAAVQATTPAVPTPVPRVIVQGHSVPL